MRRSFLCTAVVVSSIMCVSLTARMAMGQLMMQFPVERDAGIDSWDNHDGYGGEFDKSLETEEWNNSGAAPNVRGKKFTQHTAIMDWDTDAINQWIDDNTNPGDTLSWTFNLYPLDGPIDDVQIATIESENDWVEGDGPEMFTNFNWSEDTGAVTQNFAVTYYTFDAQGAPVLDLDRSLPWIDNDSGTGGIDDNQYSVLTLGSNFSPGDPIPDFVNSVDLSAEDLDIAAVDFTYASVPLDDDLISAILQDPLNRGIVFGPTNDAAVNGATNWQFYTRESNGFPGELAVEFPGPVAPFLEVTVTPGADQLQAGDADQDLDFDQLGLVRVQVAAKYLTGQAATWGEGDWDGAPGGSPGSPPAGNARFDQLDVISALAHGLYLTGPYSAVAAGGAADDGQTSLGYNPSTGELFVDAPAGAQLTSINIDSAAGVFTGAPADNLGGSFDNDADNNIFKATFGSSFGSISFGLVAQTGLDEAFLLNDLTVVGSLAGGGDLGNVDLIYVPEPGTIVMAGLGIAVSLGIAWRRLRAVKSTVGRPPS